MNRVFVDTAALIALGNKQDIFHAAALQKQQQLVKNQTHFISSQFVIAEFCNAFSRVKWRYKWLTVFINQKRGQWSPSMMI